MYPNTREDDLMISRVDDELVIFDQRTEEYHHLTTVATFVWDRCDGETDVDTLADQLDRAFEVDSPRPLIEEALAELREADLLEDSAPAEPERPGNDVGRRTALLKMAATGAAVASLPLVTTMAAPRAAEASSTGSSSGGGGSSTSGSSGGGNTDSGSGDSGLHGGPSGNRGGSSWWEDLIRWVTGS